MSDPTPSEEQLLFAILPLQQAAMRQLAEADALKRRGDLPAAVAAYDLLISTIRQHLALAEQNNHLYPQRPFEIVPIVNPLLDALLTQADLRELLDERDAAERQREEALDLAEKYLSLAQQADRQRQRANSLVGQGKFHAALTMLNAALDLARKHGTPVDVANITVDLLGILEWLGDYERALAESEATLELIRPYIADKPPSFLNALTAVMQSNFAEAGQQTALTRITVELEQIRARCNRYLGNLVEAEQQFRAVRPRIPSNGQVGIDFQIAAVQIAAGNYRQGLELLESMKPFFTGIARYKLGAMLSYQAEAMLGLGQVERALETSTTAIREIIHYQDYDVLWRAYSRQARALALSGKAGEAFEAYGKALEIIDNLRKAPLGYRLDSTYLNDKLPIFEQAIDLACDGGYGERCCQYIEMVKSRGLTATLSIPRGEQAGANSPLEQQVDRLSYEIDGLTFAAYQNGWTEDLETRRNALLAERAGLLERIRFEEPRWRSLSEPVTLDLDRLQHLLVSRKQAALTLFSRPEQVVAVLLSGGEYRVGRARLTGPARAALEAYQANLQKSQPDPQAFDPAYLGISASDLVPEELLDQALKADSLVIVPHGPLHLLPWAGLQHRGRRLFEDVPVGILPNLSCIPALSEPLTAEPRLALFGAPDYSKLRRVTPLTFGEAELIEIQEIYTSAGGHVDGVKMGSAATEAGFWEMCRFPKAKAGVLHVSCHGVFESGEPMHSGLLLTDGRADAAEIARTRLAYDEIVLSACHTGYRPTEVGGVPLTGDDILGLPSAFLEAGVRSILVSIPPAREDVTLRFMTLYHQQRAEGIPPMFALQATLKEMQDMAESPPHLWTGYCVYGCQ